MKKKLFALITCVIMVAAITAPVLAEEASPEITTRSMPPIGQTIKIGNGYTVDLWLTVASFASAGNNDPVYVWSNRGMATQNWKLARFPYNAREPLNKSPSFSAERENRRLPLGSSDSVGK